MLLFYRFLQNLSSPARPTSLDLFSVRADRKNGLDQNAESSATIIPGFVLPSQQVLACSSSAFSGPHKDLIYGSGHRLCEDRRGVFDHLRPRLFIKNTVRVVAVQSTNVVTTYYNDQLKEDMEREERIQRGEITRAQANKEDEEWQEREWNKRMEALPHRIMVAYLKYHAIVLVMRLYEHIASKMVDEERLDKLTLDTFDAAKRLSRVSKDGMTRDMTQVCWRANIISFLADYSVNQVILAFGYYKYIQEQRRKIKSGGDDNDSTEGEIHAGSLMLSFMRKSTLLALSRGISLAFASIGGGIGSSMWPGWGTLVGTNFGDSIGSTLTDDVDTRPSSH